MNQNDSREPNDVDASASADCSTASIDNPQKIKSLIQRCEAGMNVFSNDEMSEALKFSSMIWSRLNRMADHYECMSRNFMPEDIRGPMMALAAKDMRHVLKDCADDCQ